MRIEVNGHAHELPAAITVAALLARLEVRGRIAIEINGELVPRSVHATQLLVDGDHVEIVQAIGGGEAVSNPGGPRLPSPPPSIPVSSHES